MCPESLLNMDIRNMNLDKRDCNTEQGISNCYTGVRVCSRIDHNGIGFTIPRRVDTID